MAAAGAAGGGGGTGPHAEPIRLLAGRVRGTLGRSRGSATPQPPRSAVIEDAHQRLQPPGITRISSTRTGSDDDHGLMPPARPRGPPPLRRAARDDHCDNHTYCTSSVLGYCHLMIMRASLRAVSS